MRRPGGRTGPPSEDIFATTGFGEDPGSDYDVADFDFDKDTERMVQGYGDMEASGTDLSKFKGRGGKILIYQGPARRARGA